MQVTVLGVGDTFSERHVTSALLLEHDGFRLAIDCPDRYAGVLRAAGERAGRGLSVLDVDHVLITHVHGDHMNGLEGLAFFKRFVQDRRLTLLASPEVRASIWDHRLRAPMETLWDGREFRSLGFADYFDHQPLSWSEPVAVGPFTLRTYRTRHHVPTSALLVEAAGRRFGYSADTAYDPELICFLSAADLIVHETNYGPAHTAYTDLLTAPAEVRARMRLIHYPDAFDAVESEIPVLVEGEVIDVL